MEIACPVIPSVVSGIISLYLLKCAKCGALVDFESHILAESLGFLEIQCFGAVSETINFNVCCLKCIKCMSILGKTFVSDHMNENILWLTGFSVETLKLFEKFATQLLNKKDSLFKIDDKLTIDIEHRRRTCGDSNSAAYWTSRYVRHDKGVQRPISLETAREFHVKFQIDKKSYKSICLHSNESSLLVSRRLDRITFTQILIEPIWIETHFVGFKLLDRDAKDVIFNVRTNFIICE